MTPDTYHTRLHRHRPDAIISFITRRVWFAGRAPGGLAVLPATYGIGTTSTAKGEFMRSVATDDLEGDQLNGADPLLVSHLRLVLAVVQRAERDASKGDRAARDWVRWLRQSGQSRRY